MKKATIVGHFGFGLEYLDGQTVKTKIVADELCRQFGDEQIKQIDTHGGIKTLLKAPFQIWRALKNSSDVIILPAHNGLRINAPLLSFEKRFFKNKKIHYIVIGGWLPEFLKKHTRVKRALQTFDGIYVETSTMQKALKQQGFANVYVMPNCKRLDIVDEAALVRHSEEPHMLCTFSRVMKGKGIEEAINAIQTVNEKLGRVVYSLDIYGQVDIEQTAWFEELKNRFPKCVRYCGCVDFDKSVEVLKNYYALLFPTHFYTEGIPGTIIDAYAAGVPVISAKWESFSDVVDDGMTGIGYEFDRNDAFINILLKLADEPVVLTDMKLNCVKKAKMYLPETVIQVLLNNMLEEKRGSSELDGRK